MNELINKIGTDKLLHFFAGAWICAVLSIVTLLQDWEFTLPMFMLSTTISTLIVFVVSVIKEMVDSEFNWKDILAAIIGCLTIYAAYGFGYFLYIMRV